MQASIILERLGGTRFQTLSKARDFCYPRDGIAFRMVRKGINRVEITTKGDHYVMVFFDGMTEIARAEVEGNQLQPTFVHHTGIAM